MADVNVSPEVSVRDGVAITHKGSLSASDNYKIPNNGRLLVYVDNGGSADITVTIVTPGQAQGLAIADYTATVEDGDNLLMGPFDPSIFNDSDGKIDVSFSAVGSVTLASFVF